MRLIGYELEQRKKTLNLDISVSKAFVKTIGDIIKAFREEGIMGWALWNKSQINKD